MMEAERILRIRRVFDDVVERPPADRPARVRRLCADDPDMRALVEGMLRADAGDRDDLLRPSEWIGEDPFGGVDEVAPIETAVELDRDPVPVRIGEYRILGVLGRGGMGVVYEAEDPRLERRVAVKMLPPSLAGSLARVEDEAKILAGLNHPSIATVHSLEDDEDGHFFTLELIPGATLAERVADGPLRLGQGVRLARELVDALAAAHGAGVIHRDLKPGNLKITPEGRLKVLDFGIARAAGTGGGGDGFFSRMSGTPGYMSPGQVRGEEPSQADDVWSLGCVLFEAWSGARAFPGGSVTRILANSLEGEPDWNRVGFLPELLQSLLRRCLARDARDRPSLEDLRRALVSFAELEEPLVSVPAETRTRRKMRGNLPNPASPLIGRQDEAFRLRALLREARLVTVVGPAGVGKTRLCLETRDLADECPGGLWWVDLAPATGGREVVRAVAASIGRRETAGDLIDGVARTLAKQRSLLVLDNCEHVMDEVRPLVVRLREAGDRISMLCTSRESLRIEGERIFALGPLGLPAEGDADEASLREAESVRFFLARGREARADLALDSAEAASIGAICRRLEGVPLALELAARRLRVLRPAELLGRLEDQFRVLRSPGDEDPRHRSLRAAIGWSYELLDSDLQRLLRVLSIFRGGWTVESAESVAAGAALEVDALDGIEALLEKSLVTEMTAPDDRARYTLLESVRQFAREELRGHGEESAARTAHAGHFADVCGDVEDALQGAEQKIWRERIHSDHDNFRAVMEASLEGLLPLALGARMVVDISRFWQSRGHWVEGREHCQTFLERGRELPASLRAEVLLVAGNMAHATGDFDGAAAAFEESLRIQIAEGNEEGRANAYTSLARALDRKGETDRAVQLIERAIPIWRRLGRSWQLAAALGNLGIAHFRKGEYTASRDRLGESREIRKRIGDHVGVASVSMNLGNIAWYEGRLDEATRLYTECIEELRELDDPFFLAGALGNLAAVLKDRGEIDESEQLHEESLRIRRRHSDRIGIAASVESFGHLAIDRMEWERALLLITAAERMREDLRSPWTAYGRTQVEKALDGLRDRLGGRYERVRARGRAMRDARAIALALREDAPSVSPPDASPEPA